MPKLTETDKKIIDNIISLVDWDQVIKFYKIEEKPRPIDAKKMEVMKQSVEKEEKHDEKPKQLEFKKLESFSHLIEKEIKFKEKQKPLDAKKNGSN